MGCGRWEVSEWIMRSVDRRVQEKRGHIALLEYEAFESGRNFVHLDPYDEPE